MLITNVAIRRYRAFDQNTDLPLHPLTVLTGPNNLGKSTVLAALELFFSVFNSDRPYGLIRGTSYKHEDDYPKKHEGRAGRRWPTRISVTFSLSVEDSAQILAHLDGEEPLSEVEVILQFPWDSDAERFRPKYEVKGVNSDDVASAFHLWLRENVRYVYIPAARNVHDFRRGVFSELIQGALKRVSRSRQRLQALEKLLEDVKTEIATVEADLVIELQQYLPDVRQLNFTVNPFDLERLVSLGDLTIDDGANTTIQHKGDGFKSLFSISLLQYIARQRHGTNLIFAIEEPEAHLHSSAIYKIKETLRSLGQSFQVLVTTHSPILVQRDDMGANVIVERLDVEGFAATARAAHSLAEVRRSLGIKPHENMTTAEVVVVVEGLTEERTLPALMATGDQELEVAFREGRLRVLGAGGGSNIPSVVRALARDATSCIVLADSDTEGRTAIAKVRTSGFIQPHDVFAVPPRPGCDETEFEDLFDPTLYLPQVAADVGLTLTVDQFETLRMQSGTRGSRHAKWSQVMETAAHQAGLDWTAISTLVKTSVANSLALAAAHGQIPGAPWTQAIGARLKAYLREQ